MRVLAKQFLIGITAILLLSASLSADVKQDSESKVKIKGTLGSVMKLFGANKATRTVTYLKGDLQRTDTFDKKKKKVVRSEIVDLEGEKFIKIDRKKKKYTIMTFEEWREMLKSGLASVLNQQDGEYSEDEPQQSNEPKTEVKVNFTVDVETPGDTEIMAGHNAEKAIVTLKVEGETITEKEGQEPQKAKGGMIVRSTNWMAHSVKGQDEMMAFALKLAEKLGMAPGQGGMAGLAESVMQSNEQLAAAITKLQEESDKLSGVPMRTHTVFESFGQEMKPKENESKQEGVKMPSVGGLLKGFGKKKKKDNVLLEIKAKVNEYSTETLSGDLFVLSSKYKLEKKK